MRVYISIVSHRHTQLIEKLGCLPGLSKDFDLVVKINEAEDISYYKGLNNVHVINEYYGLGFGQNNNSVFSYCKKELNMVSDDYFLILNPDVYIEPKMIFSLIEHMRLLDCKIASINLFKDREFIDFDNSIRNFPSLLDFFSSFFLGKNNTEIDKDSIDTPKHVDWSSGAFLMFKASHYECLGGFDEKYHMYCEDIDICLRSAGLGERLMYFPDIRAIHLTGRLNRKVFSKHFYWHVKSIFRYIRSRYGLTSPRTSLKY